MTGNVVLLAFAAAEVSGLCRRDSRRKARHPPGGRAVGAGASTVRNDRLDGTIDGTEECYGPATPCRRYYDHGSKADIDRLGRGPSVAGGSNLRPARSIFSIIALFVGALSGAYLLRYGVAYRSSSPELACLFAPRLCGDRRDSAKE